MPGPCVAEERLQVERLQIDRQHIFAVDGAPEFLDLVRALFQYERYNVTTTNFVPRTFDHIAVVQPDPSSLISSWGRWPCGTCSNSSTERSRRWTSQ